MVSRPGSPCARQCAANPKESLRISSKIFDVARLVVLLALVVFAAHPAIAQQNTGDVLGIVTDPSGAAVTGATVTIINLGTQETKTLKSNDSGAFTFPNLDPGHYKVTITGAGFSTAVLNDVQISAGDRRRVDTQLTIGGTTTTVEVQTAPPTLQTDSSTLNTSLSEQAVANLPLNGRNYTQLVQITPGATEGNPGGLATGNAPDDRRQGSSVSINSQSDVLNNNMIDGLDNNERIIGTVGVRPSIDSIQEVKILTNNYTADSGRAAGAVINIITKAGTNNFHGTLYEFLRNDKLNAYPYQFGATNPKPELRQNQFGGSLGGPILKDRTFFFGDAEFFRLIQGTQPSQVVVPTAYEQTHIGDFSDQVVTPTSGSLANTKVALGPNNQSGIAYDPVKAALYCGSPKNPGAFANNCAYNPVADVNGVYQWYPGNVIPAGALDPVGVNYFKLYSLPNLPGPDQTNYVGSGKRKQFFTTYDIRVDHKITSSNSIFARYSSNSVFTHTPSPALPAKVVAGVLVDPQTGVQGDSPQTARNAQLNFTHTFTPNLLMLLGAGYTLVDNYSTPTNFGVNPNTAFGEPGINFNVNTSALGGLGPGAGLTGFGAGRPGFVPLHDKDNTYQINGAVFYTHGKQSIKIGAALIRRHALNFQESNGMGNIGFQNGAPGLLTGQYNTAVRNNNFGNGQVITNYYRVWEPSWFFQDDWRVTQKLTLNLGVRWDMFTPFVDKYNHISNFFPTNGGTLVVAGTPGVSRAANVRYSYKDFQPRVGFAFNPRQGTVIRGGFGISFFPSTQASPASLKNQPWVASFSCQNSAGNCPAGFTTLRQGLPTPSQIQANAAAISFQCVTQATLNANPQIINPVVSPVCYPQALNSSEPDYHDSYLEQFNVTVQQQFLHGNTITIAYVGALGRRLGDAIGNTNLAPTTATAAQNVNKARYFNANPNVTNVPALLSGGSSSYHGMQAIIERRFSNGLGYNVSTTWAHEMDNVAQIGGGGTSNVISLDPNSPYYHGRYDYGNGALDQRNRLVVQGNYAPTFFKSATGIEGALLKGWRLNVLSVWTTGLPFTVTNNSTRSFANPFSTAGDRPNVVGDPFANPPAPAFGKIPYFNPGAFAAQALGTGGNEHVNQYHAPPAQHVDGSIAKDFPVREQVRLNFRAEGFNLLNSVMFAGPSAGLGTANTGYITSTRADYQPRLFQFALRLEF